MRMVNMYSFLFQVLNRLKFSLNIIAKTWDAKREEELLPTRYCRIKNNIIGFELNPKNLLIGEQFRHVELIVYVYSLSLHNFVIQISNEFNRQNELYIARVG